MSTKIQGYNNALTEAQIATVNESKMLEELVLRLIEDIARDASNDPRWIALARTQLQQGFMALNRAVFQPGRIETLDVNALTRLSNRLNTGKASAALELRSNRAQDRPDLNSARLTLSAVGQASAVTMSANTTEITAEAGK